MGNASYDSKNAYVDSVQQQDRKVKHLHMLKGFLQTGKVMHRSIPTDEV